MGFGPSFRQLVLVFYTDVESAVIINSCTSPFFQPSRGVLQGCPLSPLLYVLCAEVLAYNLRASSGIAGVHLPNSAQIRHKSAGGFGVVDFRTKANALRLQWIQHYFSDPPSIMSLMLRRLLAPIPRRVGAASFRK